MLVEAAALGVPLLAARTGGMADVLQDGRTALLFEPGDEAGCGWALRRAASLDQEQRARSAPPAGRWRKRTRTASLEVSRYIEVLAESRAAADAVSPLVRTARA